MKRRTLKLWAVFGVAVMFFLFPAAGEAKLSTSKEKKSPVKIEELYISGKVIGKDAGVNRVEMLRAVMEQLKERGIKVSVHKEGENIGDKSELEITVDNRQIENSGTIVYVAESSLKQIGSVVKAPDKRIMVVTWRNWRMGYASAEEVSAKIGDEIKSLINEFLTFYGPGAKLKEAVEDINEPAVKEVNETAVKKVEERAVKEIKEPAVKEVKNEDTNGSSVTASVDDTGKGGYMASKKGKLFHKPECPAAKRIKADNLVVYAGREEAVKAGKTPCAICKP